MASVGEHRSTDAWAGGLFALAAYGTWGVAPAYWKALSGVDPIEVVAHRILWAALFLGIALVAVGRLGEVRAAFRSLAVLRTLALTAALIVTNWCIFVWAVQSDHLLEASLGYFINPLVNVALGVLFLRERLHRLQLAAVALAAAGVLELTLALGAAPWVALALATSFGFYALLRKVAPVAPLVGLFVETALCAPFALALIVHRELAGTGALGTHGLAIDALLVASGIVTALPLVWFAAAARRLTLSSLGLFQYIAPTGQFLLAAIAYGEPVTRPYVIAFGVIWVALGLYSAQTRRLALARAGGHSP